MGALRALGNGLFLRVILVTACSGGAGAAGGDPSIPGGGSSTAADPEHDAVKHERDGGSLDAASGSSGPTRAACDADRVPVNGRCVERRQPTVLAPGWNQIKPGGDTLCADGDEFSFFVRQGTVNRVLIFMQGGGACWDDVTCAAPIYTHTVTPPGSSGILDPENPDNRFKDWHVVYVPYCTADVAFGNVDRQYTLRTLHHRGFVNGEAVRNWVYQNITAPEAAVVSGCSAGAVGVVMHGTYLAEAYKDNPDIHAVMVTDSFQGLAPDDFKGLESWNFVSNVPPWLPELKQPPFNVTRALLTGAPRYPTATIAHFNYANDAVQASFYGAMGGNPAQTSALIGDAVHTLANKLPNYRYYLAPGTSHCVFESDRVYDTEVSGVNLAEWLGKLAHGEEVGSVEEGGAP